MLFVLAPSGAGADAERVCPTPPAGPSPLHVAPYIADISAEHAVIRWVDGVGRWEGLVGPTGEMVRERVQAIPAGGGWVHSAVTPLRSASTVELFVNCGPWSGHAVRATPAPGPGTPVTFVATGDNRSNDGDPAQIAAAIDAAGPDVLINTGDMVMTGLPEHWTRFFEIERALLRRTPLFAAMGNHEVIDRPGLYDVLFDCPRPGPRGTRSCVRDYGDLRVVQVDSESSPASQADWLRSVLTETPQAGAKRVEVIAMHRPVYTFSRHPPDLEWRAVLHPIAVDADVEVVFQGHNHTYERFEVDGVTYVTTGGGGAPRYPANYAIRDSEAHLRKKGVSVLHYVVARVSAGRIDMEAVEPGAGTVIDKFQVD